MSHYEDLQVPWPALSLSLKRFRHRPLCFCLSEWVSVVDSNEIHRAMDRYLLTKPDAADGTEVKLIWVYYVLVGLLFASGSTICEWVYVLYSFHPIVGLQLYREGKFYSRIQDPKYQQGVGTCYTRKVRMIKR